MATTDVPQPAPGEGAIAFAGVLLVLIGFLSIIQGIAALADSSALVDAPELIAFGSSTWGTTLIVLGLAANLMAISLWTGAAVRWIGCLVAAVNAVVQLLFLPAFPFWALTVFALDVLAIYALVVRAASARGGRR